MATATLTQIIAILRAILGDTIQNGVDIFQYTTSSVFTLTESNTQTVSSVAVNDITSGITYTYDSTLQKVTISSSLTTDDIVEIDYTFYSNYSDTELTNYIKNALTYISINRYCNFELGGDNYIYPIPSNGEENLIATVAAIIINPENRSYRTPDFSISVRNPMSTIDIISKTIGVFKKNSSGMYAIM